jgi:hypothetical protein
MQSIILMSALTMTSGLFGGGRSSCPSGQCGAAMVPASAYQYTYAPTAYYAPQARPVSYLPTTYYTQPSTAAAPAQMYYYVYPTATACPNGSCYRR